MSDELERRWAALAQRPRSFRRTRVVVAALLGVVVVLVGTAYVGYWSGANENPIDLARRAVGVDDRDTTRSLSGRDSYLNNCASCHGPAGEGGSLSIKGPAFTSGGELAGLSFDERVAKISRGKPLRGMPAWKFRISDEEIRRIAAYTQLLSGQSPAADLESGR